MSHASPAADPIVRAVDDIRRLDGIDVAFAARIDDSRTSFTLGEMRGARAGSLNGLVSPIGYGVGGRCVALRRPVSVVDYVRARHITHQFDGAVSQEGLRAVLAVPFRVGNEVRGVVYGAARRTLRFGERFTDAAVSIVRSAERPPEPPATPGSARLDHAQVRELHAELRAIAAAADPAARERLLGVCARLADGRPPRPGTPRARLTPREVDVLALVAVGCSNADVAARLALQVETVKSYLKSAMGKLGSHNRVEAVVCAQRAGLIP
ncbi:LuxR C-terminal-related transcriptional regulator [Pseudonocardia sp.]|uniref:LuxR C-terminal-related transcriptional regulator n=1 Tax=Pseudonocardia sp. TaxID=60912 RepID=UPI00262392A3|nr:LuxR C-terminal-related transcriptional regulator [Pseudonocardia sp.]